MTDSEVLASLEGRMAKIVRFFECRDEMNSWVHLESPRWSPITEEARGVQDGMQGLIMDMRMKEQA